MVLAVQVGLVAVHVLGSALVWIVTVRVLLTTTVVEPVGASERRPSAVTA